jgi:hypothetical protein
LEEKTNQSEHSVRGEWKINKKEHHVRERKVKCFNRSTELEVERKIDQKEHRVRGGEENGSIGAQC